MSTHFGHMAGIFHPGWGKTGALNPLSKPVQTPLGEHASLTEAAAAHGLSLGGLRARMKRLPDLYYYIPQ